METNSTQSQTDVACYDSRTISLDEDALDLPADERTRRLVKEAAKSLAETRAAGRLVERPAS